jgi:hypothetical protein
MGQLFVVKAYHNHWKKPNGSSKEEKSACIV